VVQPERRCSRTYNAASDWMASAIAKFHKRATDDHERAHSLVSSVVWRPPAVHQPEIQMPVSSFRPLSAELDRLLHLFDRLRPILRIGGLDREIPECLHAIEEPVAVFDRPESSMYCCASASCRCQAFAPGCYRLRLIRIHLGRDFPVSERVSSVSHLMVANCTSASTRFKGTTHSRRSAERGMLLRCL
jgi:hypothetical protein